MDPRDMEGRSISHSSEREEEYGLFPIYSERSQQDMSAMVSALTQVIGGSNSDSLQQHEGLLTSSHNNTSTQNNNEQSQAPQQEQGNISFSLIILAIIFNLLRSNWI